MAEDLRFNLVVIYVVVIVLTDPVDLISTTVSCFFKVYEHIHTFIYIRA